MLHGLMMDYQLTIDRILEHANRNFHRSKVITKQPDGSMHEQTYPEMYNRIKRMANALVKLGVEPGDRVGTFGWNNYQHLELYFAIPGAGAVCHTLNIRLSAEQLSYIVEHAADKVVFIDGTLLPLYESLAGSVSCVEHYVLYNAPRDVETSLENVLFYEDLIAESSEEFEWRSTDERMAMGLCYTSGTTGDPKGALYSHRSMYMHTMGENQAMGLGLVQSDTILAVVPQFHAMSWGLPYAALMSGANLLMPGRFLQPAPLAEMIEAYKVTVAAGVPTIWNGLYYELKNNTRDISSIRALVVGGSAMPRELTKLYESQLGVNVVHAWGMTELSPLGTVSNLQEQHQSLSDEEKWDIKATQGYNLAGIEMRIVDDENNELPWDGKTMGELQVRGPWVVKQYYKREVSEEHFSPDGWFRTGDVSTINPDGYMTITDRTKDLVKSGGEWISSVALENALIGHEKVMEAAVFAVPDQRWSERPCAVIVPIDGTAIEDEELRQFLLDLGFAKFWLPDQFIQVADIPKTSVGKLNKKVLRAQYTDGGLV